MSDIPTKEDIAIYESSDGRQRVEVKVEADTVWMTQKQMSELFGTSTDNVGLHLKNVYSDRELEEPATTEDFSVVRKEGSREVNRTLKHYNLDAIISIGYRVNSKRGTQFRIWANQVLKGYLVKGYALNKQKLRQQQSHIQNLEKTLQLFQKAQNEILSHPEASGLLSILTDYTQSFILLNQYDTGNFPEGGLNTNVTQEINHDEAMHAIQELKIALIAKKEATELFGNPKDDSFAGILGNIVQSFGDQYLYSSIEEQAAHLLYFIIKNHPFSDGNKRIGAFLFIWFLQRNRHHLKSGGEVKINDNALVALALLVAQSEASQKDIMIKLVVNLVKDSA